jgi:hypothetical protein
MTMTKKRLLLIAAVPLAIVVTLAIGVTLGVLVMLPPRPGVTKANFDSIKPGMKKAEVEEIFGREAQRMIPILDVGFPKPPLFVPGAVLAVWVTDNRSGAYITFRDDCVTHATWHDSIDHDVR